jgi:hypothetical protein
MQKLLIALALAPCAALVAPGIASPCLPAYVKLNRSLFAAAWISGS